MKSARGSDGEDNPLCPSAQPSSEGSVLLGVVLGTAAEPELKYLNKAVAVTDELLALSDPVAPTEIYRFAAPCSERGCAHFDGAACGLVNKIIAAIPPLEQLQPCPIRPRCRWWLQRGKDACLRCPGVVTEDFRASAQLRNAADPAYEWPIAQNK